MCEAGSVYRLGVNRLGVRKPRLMGDGKERMSWKNTEGERATGEAWVGRGDSNESTTDASAPAPLERLRLELSRRRIDGVVLRSSGSMLFAPRLFCKRKRKEKRE